MADGDSLSYLQGNNIDPVVGDRRPFRCGSAQHIVDYRVHGSHTTQLRGTLPHPCLTLPWLSPLRGFPDRTGPRRTFVQDFAASAVVGSLAAAVTCAAPAALADHGCHSNDHHGTHTLGDGSHAHFVPNGGVMPLACTPRFARAALPRP